jgi:hypothetical protein
LIGHTVIDVAAKRDAVKIVSQEFMSGSTTKQMPSGGQSMEELNMKEALSNMKSFDDINRGYNIQEDAIDNGHD